MAIQSLGQAFSWMAKTPLVWLSGVASAAILMLGWYLYTTIGVMTAVSVVTVLLFVLPAFLAGTYGIISENSTSAALFGRYAVTGYFRCLLPILLTILIAWLIWQFVAYLLMAFGMNLMASTQAAMFIFIPVIFFCYFADVTAVVNKLRMFQSIKDSFLRVMNGSIFTAVFYLINVMILLASSFVASFIWTTLAADQLMPLVNMTETELLAITPEEMLALFSEPGVIFATFVTLALCALILVPLFTVYKAVYFKKTAPIQLPTREEFAAATAAAAEQEGEYDEKGRWYKYK
ncbi:hypothetical protein [Methanorbis furvi]|uniref:Uncharacterized protein n=1 Tax=Methanorbis furvi TaxID=3028299 RepID=A0AAE4SB29_9EURY|nr:hypothetical protein [Methanocorpusculaceae archaeon Ag1]